VCELHSDWSRDTLLRSLNTMQYRCTSCGERHILALAEQAE
jgi:hypothetical protein